MTYSANPTTGIDYQYTYHPTGSRLSKTNLTTGVVTHTPNDYLELNPAQPEAATIEVTAGNLHVISITEELPHYVVVDHLNSTIATTDIQGTTDSTIHYTSFGQEDYRGGSYTEDDAYTGHEKDLDTGLVYMEARYYSAELSRFLAQDPASLYAPENFLADPQQLNLYSYVANNPVRYVDPDGNAAVLAALWMAFEVGSTLYDVGAATVTTFKAATGNASWQEAAVDVGLVGVGLLTAGSGQVTKQAVKQADNLVDAGKTTARQFTKEQAEVIAKTQANGHSYDKHILGVKAENKFKEFGGEMRTRNQFSDMIQDTVLNPAESKSLPGGREAYYNSNYDSVTIFNPKSRDMGTTMQPTRGGGTSPGKQYFDNLKERSSSSKNTSN